MNECRRIDLLIVDDDVDFRPSIARRFSRHGYQVWEAADGDEALALANQRQFDVAILDMMLPGVSGLELLKRLKATQPECEILMLTGQGTIVSAVEAMKLGAFDYITKPFPLAELELLIERAYQHRQICKENRQLQAVIRRGQAPLEIIGESAAMKEIFRLVERAAPTDKAILIQGESGTGKELMAKALHAQSKRAEKPLIVINCAALPEPLLESELFGHEKGAFTGAVAAKPGLFELADGGTLFIDEIAELAGSLQAKLLRVLEDGSMRRVGSLKERRVDVRLLAATNRIMAEEVAAGRFREDLYYRINVMSLLLPPLRERDGDLRLLVERFLGPNWTIEHDAMEAIARYRWPGNVRQLSNAIERAKIMADPPTIDLLDLPPEVVRRDEGVNHAMPAGEADHLQAIERAHIEDVLTREGGNKARTARALGINRRSLYRLLDKFKLN